MLGTGVGGAVILDGQVIHGRRGAAAEIGHMPALETIDAVVASPDTSSHSLGEGPSPDAGLRPLDGIPNPSMAPVRLPAGRQTAMLWRREYSPKLEKP